MKKSILFGAIGLVVGIVISGAVASYAVNGNHTNLKKVFAITSPTSVSDMSMTDMNATLAGKTGDDFDKAFLEEMIAHHQGAIQMANLALANAKHQEIKDLAKGIVSAQSGEISTMRAWEMQWGYISTTSMPGMNM